MKLVKVSQTPVFTIKCVSCRINSMSDKMQFYADTEGKPFHDYYCTKCTDFTKVTREVHFVDSKQKTDQSRALAYLATIRPNTF